MKILCAAVLVLGFTLDLFAQPSQADNLTIRKGTFTFKQQACNFNDKGMFSTPEGGVYGSPRGMVSKIYLSNDTLANLKVSSVSSQDFKTIHIPGDSCIYFIINEKPICFEEHQSQDMSLISSKS